jgi:hypothetical protein
LGAGNFYGTAYDFFTIPGVIFHLSTFTDNPLVARETFISAIHVVELRSRIAAVRARFGLRPYAYTDAALAAGMLIKARHILDLRTALAETYTAAGMTPPNYTDPNLGSGTVIKALDMTEIRSAITAIE